MITTTMLSGGSFGRRQAVARPRRRSLNTMTQKTVSEKSRRPALGTQAFSAPPATVTFPEVLAWQPSWISRLADSVMTHEDALQVFAFLEMDPAANHRFLPMFSVPAAWAALREMLREEIRKCNRQRTADFKASLPGGRTPYLIPQDAKAARNMPEWMQLLADAHWMRGQPGGVLIFDTLSGSLLTARPGDHVWVDDAGEVRALSPAGHLLRELPPFPWPEKRRS